MAKEKEPFVHYLGRFKTANESDPTYIVLFTDMDEGTVVMSEHPDVAFGTHGSFAEELFEILPQDLVVRLSN